MLTIDLDHCPLKDIELLAVLLDKCPVQTSACHAPSPHGAVFYSAFKSTVNAYVVTRAVDFLARLCTDTNVRTEGRVVGSVFMGLLEQVSRDRDLRKKSAFIGNFTSLRGHNVGCIKENMLSLMSVGKVYYFIVLL